MHLEIVWNNETTPVDLVDGAVTVGGGARDDIRLAGLPVKLLILSVDGARLSIKAIRPLRIGQQLFPAHVARLVMPGESLTLPNDVVVRRPDDPAARERRKNMSTDFLANQLVLQALPELESRAATLTCVAGADEGHIYPLAHLETSLGRGDDADVRLHDRTVSRLHARVINRRQTYLLEDLGTTNGVYLNGKRVKGSHKLKTGDVFDLGHSVLRFDAGERAPEERTRIEPLPLPPPKVEVAPELLVSPTTELPERSTASGVEVTLVILGALLTLFGLATAAVIGLG